MNQIFRSICLGLLLMFLANLTFVEVRTAAAGEEFAASPAVSVLKEDADTKKVDGPLVAEVLYSQSSGSSGKLLQSSRVDPDGSDYDQYVWDNFTLASSQAITDIQWRGGFDPLKYGSGGSVIDFQVAIYASIPAGTEPDIVHPPLVEYLTGGNAGETPAGTVGSTAMYDYQFTLPTPFQAAAGTKYWLQIEAFQHGTPDWGIAAGVGGDSQYYRRIYGMGDAYYQMMSGDAAFSLLGPKVEPPPVEPPPNVYWIYLPAVPKNIP